MSEQLFQPYPPEFERQEIASKLHTVLTDTLLKRGVQENDGFFLSGILYETNKYFAVNNYWTAAGCHRDYDIGDNDPSKLESLDNKNPILCVELHEANQHKQSFIICRPSDIKHETMLHAMLTRFNPSINLDSESYDILSFPTQAGSEAPEIDLLEFEKILRKLN